MAQGNLAQQHLPETIEAGALPEKNQIPMVFLLDAAVATW
jgi:hypothetical protein